MHRLDIMVVKDGKLASGSSYSNSLELLAQDGRYARMFRLQAAGFLEN